MERVRALYEDTGSKEKVLVDLACSSHNALWKGNHLVLFKASLEWLRDGKGNGGCSVAIRVSATRARSR